MSIKSEIAKGVFWIAVAKYSGIFISLGITAILARNVSPAAFGTMAVAMVIMAFLDIFTDMGIGPAIIQFKELDKRQINSLFMIGGGIGLSLSLGLFFAATPISLFYDDAVLVNVTRLLCICLMFNALNIVPNGLMLRAKRFRTIAVRTLGFQFISGMVAIWGALHDWGIYALIVTPIITSIGVFCVNFYNYPQQFTLKIDVSVIKTIWGYSSFQFLFSFTNYFSRNLDKLIIGKYFSMADLGYYDKSYRLMQLPLQNITFVISPVLHPILSTLQDNRYELGVKNCKLLTVLSQISFPVGIILFFCAPEIITVIFGDNWKPSIPVFEILALSLPLQMLLSTSGSLYQAAGKTNHLFYVGICNTAVTVAGFLIAAKYFKTLNSMAWAWDITLTINFFTTYVVMNRCTFGYPMRKFFASFGPQVLNSSITTAGAYCVFKYVMFDNVILELFWKSIVIATFTFTLAHLLNQYTIPTLLKPIFNKIKKR